MKGIASSTENHNYMIFNDSNSENQQTYENHICLPTFNVQTCCAAKANCHVETPKLLRSASPQNGSVSSEYHINQYRSLMQKSNFDQEIFNLFLKSVNKSSGPLKNLPKNSFLFQNESQNNAFNNVQEKKCFTPSRRKFTDKEDIILKSAVKIFGTTNWKIIASMVPGRTPRQCRDRYTNYLAPGLVRLEWSEEEDKLLAEKYILFGPQWTKIRQYFPTRSANDIKNRYNYTVCRKVQEVQQSSSDELAQETNENPEISYVNENDLIFNVDQESNADIFKVDFIDSEDIFCQPCFFCGNEEF